jgi:hypothetical protein
MRAGWAAAENVSEGSAGCPDIPPSTQHLPKVLSNLAFTNQQVPFDFVNKVVTKLIVELTLACLLNMASF